MNTPDTETSRTKETEARYKRKAEGLLRRVTEHFGTPWEEVPDRICRFWSEQRKDIARATWRYYRAALTWYLDERGFYEAADCVRKLSETPCLRKTERTSAKKAKRIHETRINELVDYCSQGHSEDDPVVALWVLATSWVGLRPDEWPKARFLPKDSELREDEFEYLQVRNAKNSQGRTFGDTRTLRLEGFTREDIEVIENLMFFIQREDDFERFYRRIRDRLRYINKKLWPNHKKTVALYSGRHQFTANAKRAGLDKSEVAALLGHGSDRTANRHYAQGRVGYRARRVVPLDSDVDRVRVMNSREKQHDAAAADRPEPSRR